MASAIDSRQESSSSAGPPLGVRDAAVAAKERVQGVWDDAKQSARSSLNEQKDAAAEGLGNVAGALRDAAQRSEGERDGLARLTTSAADGLERLSDTLRNKDVGAMLRDMESFARNQPVAFFGVALAVGFLAVRFMKSSADQDLE